MENITIQYCFTLANGIKKIIDLKLDTKNLDLIISNQDPLPSWTNLDFQKCPNCILNTKTHKYCPLAVNLAAIVKEFEDLISYDQVHLDVITRERTVSQNTTAQKGISSLMGLVMATSGCPFTAFFKPMARFHLPLANENETIYRSTSMYLLAQFFLKNDGKDADFKLEGLKKIYENLQIINTAIVKRLSAGTKTDSSLNAIVLLDLFARALPLVIEDSLEKIRYLFTPFLLTNLSLEKNKGQGQNN
ncbi:MAG: DUF6901 family protein [bacterium]